MHKAYTTCASQYSWTTAIENHSNAKEILSGHGIQAWTSISCFDHSCTELLGNLGSPLTLKRTCIYALLISNQRTAGTLTVIKTTVCHVLLYTAIFALVYQMPHIFPTLWGQCKKLKHVTFARLNPPPPCQGIGCVVKTDWYIISIGRYKYQGRSWGIYRVHTLSSPHIWSQGFGPFAENGFRAFHRAKMSCADTQHKHNKLPKIKLNS